MLQQPHSTDLPLTAHQHLLSHQKPHREEKAELGTCQITSSSSLASGTQFQGQNSGNSTHHCYTTSILQHASICMEDAWLLQVNPGPISVQEISHFK